MLLSHLHSFLFTSNNHVNTKRTRLNSRYNVHIVSNGVNGKTPYSAAVADCKHSVGGYCEMRKSIYSILLVRKSTNLAE